MVPVLIQWKGDGPTEPIELTRERQLRSSGGFIAARNLKLRVMTSPQNRDSDAIPAAMTDARKLQLKETSYNHTVTFRDCVFQGNHLTEKMGFPGIIENSFTSELSIINCIFMGNRYGEANNPAPFGYAIRSFGPINVESSCFVGNTFRAHAPIQVFGAPHSSIGNYVDSSQDDLTCDFLAVFSSQDDTAEVKPICFDSDARSCPMKLPPTKAPTSHPVDEQLNKPTSSSSSICRCTTSIVAILTTILLTLFRGFS